FPSPQTTFHNEQMTDPSAPSLEGADGSVILWRLETLGRADWFLRSYFAVEQHGHQQKSANFHFDLTRAKAHTCSLPCGHFRQQGAFCHDQPCSRHESIPSGGLDPKTGKAGDRKSTRLTPVT